MKHDVIKNLGLLEADIKAMGSASQISVPERKLCRIFATEEWVPEWVVEDKEVWPTRRKLMVCCERHEESLKYRGRVCDMVQLQ